MAIYLVEDSSGGIWALGVTALGEGPTTTRSAGVPQTLLINDQWGNPWLVGVTTGGVPTLTAASGPLTLAILTNPLGNWWNLAANALNDTEAEFELIEILRPGAGSSRAPVPSAVTASGFDTLLLDTAAWDLVLDSNGNIALASPPYAVAQDVASAIRLFMGELWYDTTQGVPYWQSILGYPPSLQTLAYYMNQAALSVPDVVSANTNINSFANRQVNGQVSIETADGTETVVRFQ